MHTSTHIIAQRALPATRTKARWQPYHSTPSTASSSSNSTSRSPNMNTPNPSVSSPLHAQASSSNLNQSRLPLPATTAQTSKESSQRDPNKHKFAAGLIDQAVNTLSEIWRPQDIPRVFQPPSKGISPSNSTIFPSSTHPSTSKTPPPSSTQPPNPALFEQMAQASFTSATDPDQNLLPIKTFVHEVLRRSRTSGSILQAALCYLEAIRPKVPEILRQERMGIRAHYLPDSTILPATPAELEREAELCATEENITGDDALKTVLVTDIDLQDMDTLSQVDSGEYVSVSSLVAEPSVAFAVSTPSLPSPLLCPRRTFLASLILASKFFQDKCYSNRAWAKLSGLPPREIGRCERSLGQALEWRLWVGKSPVAPQSAATTPASVRTVARSQSEGSIFTTPSSSRPFLVQEEVTVSKTSELARDKQPHASGSRTGLRRCSTVPDSVFTARPTGLCEATASTSYVREQDQDMEGSYKGPTPHNQVFVSSSSEKRLSSPRPSTPPLTYSPSSTECSLGDRTVQMSTFEDNVFPSVDGSQLWLDNISTRSTAIKTTPLSLEGKYPYVDGDLVLGLVGLAANANAVSIVDTDGVAFGTRYLWQEESRYRQVEPASVH